jgi:hypothetical protein
MANPYDVAPANPLQALMLGVQGYDRGKSIADKATQDALYKQIGQQVQTGGLDNSALGQLFGLGPSAAPMLTAAAKLKESQADANTVYGTPIYGTTPDGKTALGTFNKSGQFKPIDTGTFTPTPGGIRPVDTGTAYVPFNPRTGQFGGGAPQPVGGAAPTAAPLRKDVAGAAREGALGKDAAESITNLPKALSTANETINTIDRLIKHPGRAAGTGLSSRLDPRNYIPGTDATNFHVARKQLDGKAFLTAYESLKGGGPIANAEGERATAAVARLDNAQSDDEYLDALNELRGIVVAAKDRAIASASRAREGQAGQPQQQAAPQQPQQVIRKTIGNKNYVQDASGNWFEE